MSTSRSRIRPTPARQPLKTTTMNSSATDQLASELASKLAINSSKGKMRAAEIEDSSYSMRSVNEASQTLSTVVQTGWRKSTSDSRTTLNTVTATTTKVTKHLEILRRLRPGDIDVERAAASILGKLVILEMFDLASKFIVAMQPKLCVILCADDQPVNILSIPAPSCPSANPIVLNLISVYLLYSLTTKAQEDNVIEELAKLLNTPNARTLVSWMPLLSSLSEKHLDSLLTRAYTVLNKLCTSKHKTTPSPEALFVLRMYALRCLAYTSPGTIEAGTFWNQATRYSSAFVKTTLRDGEDQTTTVILQSYNEIVNLIEKRSDKNTFFITDDKSDGFMNFCENWVVFAKRAGDIVTLQRIGGYLGHPLSLPSQLEGQIIETPKANQTICSTSPEKDLILLGTQIYNTFSQASLIMDDTKNTQSDLLRLLQDCSKFLKDTDTMLIFLRPVPALDGKLGRKDEQLSRICNKVDRAFEKLRRTSVKFFESNAVKVASPRSSDSLQRELVGLLNYSIHCLKSVVSLPNLSNSAIRDTLTRSIETLFSLSKTGLDLDDPSSYVTSFEQLKLGTIIVNSIPAPSQSAATDEQPVDIANYLRCISGAFYNFACTFYQAFRYGNAVPFLVESCLLGARSLGLPRVKQEPVNETREKEWTQLEEQLYRRWELLGICYSKSGDRKNAYNAFRQAVYAFPFDKSGLSAQSYTTAPDTLFGPSASQSVKQLVSLIDRMTYLGACELFLPPTEVSVLSSPKRTSTKSTKEEERVTPLPPSIYGLILQRQLDSLEASQWKEGVRAVLVQLLQDSLNVFSSCAEDAMPIRKARSLVKCLEFLYQDQVPDGCLSFGFKTVEEIGTEIESLCAGEDFGKDSGLCCFAPQYRIAGHLWIALHAHRRVDKLQRSIMTERTDNAWTLIKELLSTGSDIGTRAQSSASPKTMKKVASPKTARIVSPRRTRTTRSRPGPPPAPKKAAPSKTTRTRTSATKPVTPNARMRTALPPEFVAQKAPFRQPSTDPTQVQTLVTPLVFDNFDKFLSLLQLSSRILGFLSLTLSRARLLDMTRKLAQRCVGPTSDAYVMASLELAHEYVALGKLKRASTIFYPVLETVRSGQASSDVSVRFLLRFAEAMANMGDMQGSYDIYLEALEMTDQLDIEQKASTTQQRICARVKILELGALAAYIFGSLQYMKGDSTSSVEGLLQSLRLWNRAVETLTRLNPPSSAEKQDSDPFEMSALKDALPGSSSSTNGGISGPPKAQMRQTPMDGLEWRISEGLLSTMFSLTQAYFLRGSAREAEYFVKQAVDLAKQLNTPGMVSLALAKQGEIQLHLGLLEQAQTNLTKASTFLSDIPGLDTVEITRLKAELNVRINDEHDAQELFENCVKMLEDLDVAFRQFDNLTLGPRRSLASSPKPKDRPEVLAPDLLASLLCQQLWLSRNEIDDTFNAILEKLLSLTYAAQSKAEENVLMGRLTLHGVYGRFRSDMFTNSLTESTIAIPIGMSKKEAIRSSVVPSPDIVEALANAENYFWAYLNTTAAKGNVMKIREASVSLALVGAFRTSLGDKRDGPSVMATLLDAAAALTLRFDILDAIFHKIEANQYLDDLQWPVLSEDRKKEKVVRSAKSYQGQNPRKKFALSLSQSDSEDEDERIESRMLQTYWESVRQKYQSQLLGSSISSSTKDAAALPDDWTVINITVTQDKSTLFLSRLEGGSATTEPLIFCIPLKGRREHTGDVEDENLTFDGALEELKAIIKSSDECTKQAVNIRPDDDEGRRNWWKTRGELDTRMKELLENIEYCWLGAFKTILAPRSQLSKETISELKSQFERLFHRCLHVKEKKPSRNRSASSSHKKSSSSSSTASHKNASPANSPALFTLDDSLIECFAKLSPKCRDEEVEDLVYFVLDLYQFHGVPVAIAEVDVDQVVVEMRGVLEEHNAKMIRQRIVREMSKNNKGRDEHLFLVLDKNVQGLPWESMPVLRGRSVSRIPGIQFLHDRLAFAKLKRESLKSKNDDVGAMVDPKKGFFILNPSGDLGRTEERFRDWTKDMKKVGWEGVVGRGVTEQEFVRALKEKDLVVYFGHGGGEQYIRSHRIRSLPSCAATMLWGCSSGALRDQGEFDRTGTPYNYMLAGCPTLVANLWDVTDKDIDKLSMGVFEKLGLGVKEVKGKERQAISVVAAVAQSRDSCKLKYLTGAAPVVYGIPFYL